MLRTQRKVFSIWDLKAFYFLFVLAVMIFRMHKLKFEFFIVPEKTTVKQVKLPQHYWERGATLTRYSNTISLPYTRYTRICA